MRTIGDRLKEQRQRAGLTQSQAAELEGLSRQYIWKLEEGENEPPAWPLLVKLARRYQCSADYLLGLTDDPAAELSAPLTGEVLTLLERLTALPGSVQTMAVELLGVVARYEEARRTERVGDWNALVQLLEKLSDDASVVTRRLLDGGSITMAELLGLAQAVGEHKRNDGA